MIRDFFAPRLSLDLPEEYWITYSDVSICGDHHQGSLHWACTFTLGPDATGQIFAASLGSKHEITRTLHTVHTVYREL